MQEAVSLWEVSFTSGTGCWGSGYGFFAGERQVAVSSLLSSSDLMVLAGPGLPTGCGPRRQSWAAMVQVNLVSCAYPSTGLFFYLIVYFYLFTFIFGVLILCAYTCMCGPVGHTLCLWRESLFSFHHRRPGFGAGASHSYVCPWQVPPA